MSTEKELDGWLRPSFELRTILYTAVMLPVVWLYADFLGFSLLWQSILTLLAIVMCLPRIKSWLFIKRYQRDLTKLETFYIKPTQLKWSDNLQWIGTGFDFTSVHAQRVWDAKKPNLVKYFERGKLFHWLRDNEKAAQVIETKKPNEEQRTLFERFSIKVSKLSKRAVFEYRWMKIDNPFKPLPPVGGNTVTHGVGAFEEKDIYIKIDDRVGHQIVLGQSRVGKTVLLRNQVSQDIQRNQGVTGVFDPKGDLELLGIIWSEAKRLGREEDFYCFLLGEPELSARYNAIASFSRLTAVAGRISNQMSGGGDDVFKDFAFLFMTYVASALLDMGEKPTFRTMKINIENLEGLFNRYGRFLMKRDNPTYHEDLKALEKPKMKRDSKGNMVEEKLKQGAMKGREYKTVITDKLTSEFYEKNPRLINDSFEGLRSTMKQDGQYIGKLTASLIPLLLKLSSGKLSEVISPDYTNMKDPRRTFSWDKIIQRKGIFYAGFSAMQDEVVAQAIGNTFFADLVAKAGEINNYGINKGLPGAKTTDITPIWLYCDEFQSLMGTEFIPLLNRSGSAGVRVTAFTQVGSDIEGKLDSAALAKIVLGNFNSIYMMRVADKETAEILTNQIGKADVLGMDVNGGVTDGGAITPKSKFDDEDNGKGGGADSFFGSRTQATITVEGHEPLISPETIMSLPKGQMIAFINRQHLYKLRLPIMIDESGESVGDMDQIRKELLARQKRPEFVF